ncbi:MAG: hypothetical protein A2622_10315 [Bdellovibrionales bacterium RIFCSPHIGHO2_01_FULL_40_29]|nr:MAG: hypothetical protein A2622_10315 [Bdellovibrionales bacterium RIFCSPHIGHO2_01_FULL_40_29]OFZ32365.1 MAG: hypothetical protein A3D17_12345 [Bdellovibrionales bacterium RIFCSPHIGHO2_02_FULL_40_15]
MYSLIKKQANDVVLTEGTLEPYIYIIKSGTLNAIKSHGRQTQVIAQLNPGDFVGEMAHLGSVKAHSASIVAAVDSELIQIDADKIFDVLAQNPIWLKALLKNLVKKIEVANNKQHPKFN